MRGSNKRVDDLEDLLRSGKVEFTNGNHSLTIASGAQIPEEEMCKTCPLSMKCCLAGVQEDLHSILMNDYPCARTQGRILFKFYSSTCLIFDQANRRVTDCNMWGHSVTTSKSIRHYLIAVMENFPFLDLYHERINDMCKLFKKHSPTVDGEAGWLWFPV